MTGITDTVMLGDMGITDEVRRALEADPRPKKDIAEKVGIDPVSLSLFQNGHRGVSLKVLDKLGDVLGVKVLVKSKSKRNTQ